MNGFPQWIGVSLCLLLGACVGESTLPSQAQHPLQSTPAVDEAHEVSGEATGPFTLAPPTTRSLRRMDIDQLHATISDVTGGIEWTDPLNGTPLFFSLRATLGKPDYALMTAENLSPTALFQKFLNDAARQVCHKLMNRELNNPEAEKILFSHAAPGDTYADAPEKIRTNLRALLLRFHGRHLAPGDPGVELWRWLYEAAEHSGEGSAIAWRTVCAGLMSHPDFYLY